MPLRDIKKRCPICKNTAEETHSIEILRKYEAKLLYCYCCGYAFFSDPHWITESYAVPIPITDTGLVARNLAISNKLASLLLICFKERGKGRYLDVAGGYGLLTRLMRDAGFNFYWLDKYSENILSKGFEMSDALLPFTAITAIEMLEHAEDPLGFISENMKFAQTDTIFFSTELFSGYPPKGNDWPYYSNETGQHISFYKKRTFGFIAKKLKLKFYTSNGMHVLTSRDFTPAMYSIACGPIKMLGRYLSRKVIGSNTDKDRDDLAEKLKEGLIR